MRKKSFIFVLALLLLLVCGVSNKATFTEDMEIEAETVGAVVTGQEETEAAEYPQMAELQGISLINDMVYVSEDIYCIYSEESGTYRFLSAQGEVISSERYEEAYPFHEGLACVCLGGKYGFLGTDGRMVIPFAYDRAAPFSEGLAYFVLGDQYGFIDRMGEPVFYLDCESVSSFREGRAYIYNDGKYGYINSDGEVVIAPVYDDASYFEEGLAMVRVGAGYGVIDLDGTEILEPQYDHIQRNGNFFIAWQDGMQAVFDRQGNLCLEGAYDSISVINRSSQNDVLFKVRQDENTMLMASGGLVLLSAKNIYALPGETYFMYGEADKGYGLADKDGNILLDPIYDSLKLVPGDEYLIAEKDAEISMIDFSGETVRSFNYDTVDDFCGQYARVSLDGKYGVIDTQGKLVVSVIYGDLTLYEDGVVLLRKNGMTYALYDSDGAQLMSDRYDNVSRLGDCYVVRKNERFGLLDSKGQVVIEPVHDSMMDMIVHGPKDGVVLFADYRESDRVLIVKTEDYVYEDTDTGFVNEITPKNRQYYSLVQNMETAESGAGDPPRTVYGEELSSFKKNYRLYRFSGSDQTFLYFYAKSYMASVSALTYSGFFGEVNGTLTELVSGYECGGTWRGDCVCLRYDKMTGEILPGKSHSNGGFGGIAYGGNVYRVMNDGSFGVIDSWDTCEMWTGGTEDYTYTLNGEETTETGLADVSERYGERQILE